MCQHLNNTELRFQLTKLRVTQPMGDLFVKIKIYSTLFFAIEV